MRRLLEAVPYGLRHQARDMERSDRACECIGPGVRVRSERGGDMLISERSRHVTKGQLCIGRRRRRESQDDIEREAGAADRPLDMRNRILRRKSGCRSALGRNLWNLPRRGHLIAPAVPSIESMVGVTPVAPFQEIVAVPRPRGMLVNRATKASPVEATRTTTAAPAAMMPAFRRSPFPPFVDTRRV